MRLLKPDVAAAAVGGAESGCGDVAGGGDGEDGGGG